MKTMISQLNLRNMPLIVTHYLKKCLAEQEVIIFQPRKSRQSRFQSEASSKESTTFDHTIISKKKKIRNQEINIQLP